MCALKYRWLFQSFCLCSGGGWLRGPGRERVPSLSCSPPPILTSSGSWPPWVGVQRGGDAGSGNILLHLAPAVLNLKQECSGQTPPRVPSPPMGMARLTFWQFEATPLLPGLQDGSSHSTIWCLLSFVSQCFSCNLHSNFLYNC